MPLAIAAEPERERNNGERERRPGGWRKGKKRKPPRRRIIGGREGLGAGEGGEGGEGGDGVGVGGGGGERRDRQRRVRKPPGEPVLSAEAQREAAVTARWQFLNSALEEAGMPLTPFPAQGPPYLGGPLVPQPLSYDIIQAFRAHVMQAVSDLDRFKSRAVRGGGVEIGVPLLTPHHSMLLLQDWNETPPVTITNIPAAQIPPNKGTGKGVWRSNYQRVGLSIMYGQHVPLEAVVYIRSNPVSHKTEFDGMIAFMHAVKVLTFRKEWLKDDPPEVRGLHFQLTWAQRLARSSDTYHAEARKLEQFMAKLSQWRETNVAEGRDPMQGRVLQTLNSDGTVAETYDQPPQSMNSQAVRQAGLTLMRYAADLSVSFWELAIRGKEIANYISQQENLQDILRARRMSIGLTPTPQSQSVALGSCTDPAGLHTYPFSEDEDGEGAGLGGGGLSGGGRSAGGGAGFYGNCRPMKRARAGGDVFLEGGEGGQGAQALGGPLAAGVGEGGGGNAMATPSSSMIGPPGFYQDQSQQQPSAPLQSYSATPLAIATTPGAASSAAIGPVAPNSSLPHSAQPPSLVFYEETKPQIAPLPPLAPVPASRNPGGGPSGMRAPSTRGLPLPQPFYAEPTTGFSGPFANSLVREALQAMNPHPQKLGLSVYGL